MPKGKLEFDLPEEGEEFSSAVNGGEYKAVLWQLDQELRSKIKYEEMNEVQWVRDFLYQCLDAKGLTLD